ncbi:MAG: choline ABC transporter substrate-binding protein [Chloroflexota bacterium]
MFGRLLQSLLLVLAIGFVNPTNADPANCKTIHLADTGWTDIAATTAAASSVLEALGYETQIHLLSVPIVYVAMKNARIDVFLGNWMPTMQDDVKRYLESGAVESVRANLENAKYTLAVPSYVAENGVTSFADIVSSGEKFNFQIYGLEPGNDGNRIINQLISERAFDLSDFKLVESSEAGMLKTITKAIEKQDWVLFLAWEPHPMNAKFDLTYLSGGDAYFGPNYGHATVYTNVRQGYMESCPNVGRFLENLVFTLEMENELMHQIMNEKVEPEQAFKQWLSKAGHAEIVKAWLDGVKTFDEQTSDNVIDTILGSN